MSLPIRHPAAALRASPAQSAWQMSAHHSVLTPVHLGARNILAVPSLQVKVLVKVPVKVPAASGRPRSSPPDTFSTPGVCCADASARKHLGAMLPRPAHHSGRKALHVPKSMPERINFIDATDQEIRTAKIRRIQPYDAVHQPSTEPAPHQPASSLSDPPCLTRPAQDVALSDSSRPPLAWWQFLGGACSPLATLAAIAASLLLLSRGAKPQLVDSLAFSSFLLLFGAVPLLDLLVGANGYKPSKREVVARAKDSIFKLPVRIFIPIQIMSVLASCWYVSALQPGWLALLGLALSLSSSAALGFTAAHELVHSPHRLDQFLSGVLLASVVYMHWSTSHHVHHEKVATPEDPASARLHESLWSFLPRSVAGNVVDAVEAEVQRLRATGQSLWSVHNRMWLWTLLPLAITGGIGVLWGHRAVSMFLAQAVGGVLLLETVNYVEHYGLSRRKLPDGRWERVGPQHSWNADFAATNCVSFQLQRHSDHHMHASRPYQSLVSYTQHAPQLPACYPAMIMLAILPPLWFRIMNPLLDAEASRIAMGPPQ